ncbi:MAG: sulfite exporter TauE/SafE family protein [Thermoleophilia bacterium]|nr:sulfite exporter TauE/SafE family protein [Thermoleophilia bacterium]
MHTLIFGLVGVAAGTLGSMVGLGGGVIIIPVLSLFLGVPVHEAIGASIVGVVATSTTAAAGYVRHDFTNIRLGITMETATTLGAIAGGLTAAALDRATLSGVFGAVTLIVAIYMLYKQRGRGATPNLAQTAGLYGGRYFDPNLGRVVTYRVRRLPVGLAASLVAGHLSGLLGIGGGVIKVPVMTLAMGVPIKAAAATSNFMIGVTAAASAYIYYSRGYVDPMVAVPVALGITLGAYVGSRVAPHVRGGVMVVMLSVMVLVLSVQMILAAFGLSIR